MRTIKTNEVNKQFLEGLPDDEVLWIYNGLDNLVAREVFGVLFDLLEPETTAITYRFECLMQGPALAMMLRGIKINKEERDRLIAEIEPRIYQLSGMEYIGKGWKITDENALIQKFAKAINDKTININSDKQLKKLFYEDLRIPYHYHYDKGSKKISVRREVLERLYLKYPRAKLFIDILFRIRDLEKQLSVLKSDLDENDRFRYWFSIGGTNTGRWSSKKWCFDDLGSNIQNITHDLREVFVPDEGYVMFYADLKTAESKGVGYLSGDEAYIEACNSDDLHVVVAKMVWPELDWGSNSKEDRLVADQLAYRHWSYRDLSKRGGHGTNYYGTPRTMSMNLRLQEKIMKRFQLLYYGGVARLNELERWEFEDMIEKGRVMGKVVLFDGAFPGIKTWHDITRTELQTTGTITTPLGRKRQFWDRLRSDSTLRKGIAYVPQSTIADILNIGLFHVWQRLDGDELQILAQGHDAILGQVKIGTEEKYRKLIKEVATIDVPVGDRIMRIEYDVNFGNNWKECS